MNLAYFLVDLKAWESCKTEVYYPDNYQSEGFIHLCYHHQISWVANTFCKEMASLLAIEINLDSLESFVREDAFPGQGMFPHLYCGLPVKNVGKVHKAVKDSNGLWCIKTL